MKPSEGASPGLRPAGAAGSAGVAPETREHGHAEEPCGQSRRACLLGVWLAYGAAASWLRRSPSGP